MGCIKLILTHPFLLSYMKNYEVISLVTSEDLRLVPYNDFFGLTIRIPLVFLLSYNFL